MRLPVKKFRAPRRVADAYDANVPLAAEHRTSLRCLGPRLRVGRRQVILARVQHEDVAVLQIPDRRVDRVAGEKFFKHRCVFSNRVMTTAAVKQSVYGVRTIVHLRVEVTPIFVMWSFWAIESVNDVNRFPSSILSAARRHRDIPCVQ